MQTGGAGALPPRHTLPGVALAEQETSGERVHASWKGLGTKSPDLLGPKGRATKQREATLCWGRTEESPSAFPGEEPVARRQVRLPGREGAPW